MESPVFVFAHGAGAPSAHPWMQKWAALLASIGAVQTFDYAYIAEGRKYPDRLPLLIDAHRLALKSARDGHPGPAVLIGKSMGARVGCHLSLEEEVSAVVCLGYPLCGGGDSTKIRDEVLRNLRAPILFVQGTRDSLCPLHLLENVRQEMRAENEMHIVEGGDHSLHVAKTQLKASEMTQDDVDGGILRAINAFVVKHSIPGNAPGNSRSKPELMGVSTVQEATRGSNPRGLSSSEHQLRLPF